MRKSICSALVLMCFSLAVFAGTPIETKLAYAAPAVSPDFDVMAVSHDSIANTVIANSTSVTGDKAPVIISDKRPDLKWDTIPGFNSDRAPGSKMLYEVGWQNS